MNRFLIRNRSMETNWPWTPLQLASSLSYQVQIQTTSKRRSWLTWLSPQRPQIAYRMTMTSLKIRRNNRLIRKSRTSRPNKSRKNKRKRLSLKKMRTSMLALWNGQSTRRRRKEQVDPRSWSYQSLTKDRLKPWIRKRRRTLHSQMEDGSVVNAKTIISQEESDATDAQNRRTRAILMANQSIFLRKVRTLILALNFLPCQNVIRSSPRRRMKPRNRQQMSNYKSWSQLRMPSRKPKSKLLVSHAKKSSIL